MPAPAGYHVSPDGQSLISDATGATVLTAGTGSGNTINAENARNDTLGNVLTDAALKDNPVAGTIRAGIDVAHGDYAKAAGDFGQGATYGTLPIPGQTGLAPGVQGVADAAPKVPGQIADAAGAAASAIANGIGSLGGGGAPGPTPDANPGADFRQQQLDYAKALQATIAGTAGPSAADIQGHQAQDRAIAQQFAAAQGATGANSALAYRQALQNAAGISQQGGADAATLRAKEVADAQNQLGTALSQGRGADLTKYSTDVGAGNTRYAADKDFQGKAIGAGAGAASGIIAGVLSDERQKTAVAPGDAEIADMLDKLHARKFQYKDPGAAGAAPGKRAGVMAQDLEKSMAGKALVLETPEGKAIDSPQAVGAMLAALASLHARTKRLEGRG
jgi:hypothetical protein